MDNNLTTDVDDECPLVLVVEDEIICQQFIIKQLQEENFKAKVQTAENVCEAVQKIEEQIKKEENFEIIFLDMYLKDNQNGLQLLQTIRERNWLKEALIIVMSGTEDQNVVEKCYEFKIQNFLKKPITKNNFRNEIIKVRKKYSEQLFCPLKNYKYLRFLGEGTSGKVVLVKEKSTKIKYAMKTIKIQSTEDGFTKPFEEMEFNRGIISPTVIKLKEFSKDEANNCLYLIIEFADGGTLNDYIKNINANKSNISDDKIISFITEIILGLYHIHEMGVLHRDIKSDNLFLCNGVVKIGDLGAARALGEGGRAATMVGTTYYMSPEVMMNMQYNRKIDTWSAGVVLFEMLTNTLPFKGFDAEEIKKKIVTVDYNAELISKTRNPELVNLLKKMLVLKQEDRLGAKECLQYPLINQRLHHLIDTNVLDLKEEAKLKLKKTFPLNLNTQSYEGSKEKSKTNDFFKNWEKAQKIDFSSLKHSYKPGFFKSKIHNTIYGSDLDTSLMDLQLKPEDAEELLKNNLIINLNNPSSLDLDCTEKVHYKVHTDENSNIDNSLMYPFEITKEDPLALSISCLSKIEKVMEILNGLDQIEEDILKLKVITSQEYFNFLVEIRNLQKINLLKCTSDQKLATILNIYMTMFKHHQIKSFINPVKVESSILEIFYSMLFKTNAHTEIIYNIGGHVISLYEMKNIVIRRNKKPYENYYFRIASGSDPRINFINESKENTLEKLLLICIDPIDNIDDYTLNFSHFTDKSLSEQIESRCKQFFKDNIKIDNSQILVPKFLNHYTKDFGNQPVDFIRFLMKYNTDPEVKVNCVVKNFNEKKIQIGWY